MKKSWPVIYLVEGPIHVIAGGDSLYRLPASTNGLAASTNGLAASTTS